MSSPPVAVRAWPLVSSSRYRHPGDVIRLIGGIVLLGCSLAASAAALRWLLGPAAPVVDSLGPTRRVTTGLVQVSCLAAAAAAPWLSRPWRRAAWLTLLLVAAARLLTGTVLPMELIIAIATG
jgi:hypothetical protein